MRANELTKLPNVFHQVRLSAISSRKFIRRKKMKKTVKIVSLVILFGIFITANISAQSNDADSYFKAGNEYYEQGKYNEAERAYSQAISRNSQISEYFFNRGLTNYKLRKDSQAIMDFTKALELPYSVTDAKNPLLPGTVQAFINDPAFSEVNKLFNGYTYFSKVYSNRASAYARLNNLDQVISDCSNAIKLDDKNDGAYFWRGLVYNNKEMYEQAINDFTNCIALNNDKTPELYFYRANCTINKAQKNGGWSAIESTRTINDLEKYLSLDPQGQFATDARSYLRQMR